MTSGERWSIGATVVACAAAAAWFGADANWDLRNYHLYVAWAWLDHRGALDLGAAQAQTWFNPLLSVPHFLAFQRLDGTALAAAVGALQGLCCAPLLLLARTLLPEATVRLRVVLVAAGMACATFIGQLGASYGDSLLALAVLSAIALLAARPVEREWPIGPIAAGILLGATVALKLALAPIALGLCLGLPLLAADRTSRIRLLTSVGLPAAAAFALLAGPWMWLLWKTWGNPVFPHLDGLFPGDWIAPGAGRDARFAVTTVGDALWRPLAPLLDWRATSDYRIRDGRIVLLFAALAALVWRWRHLDTRQRPILLWLATAFVLAYAIWLPLFGYHRYLLPWEMLAPLMLIAATAGSGYRWPLIAIALAVISTNPPNHERVRDDWPAGRPIEVPAGLIAHDTLIVMLGRGPTAHALPFLPAYAAAIRIESNLHGNPEAPFGLDRLAARRIAGHRGHVIALMQRSDVDAGLGRLAAYALEADATSACITVRDALVTDAANALVLCPLRRIPPP